MKVDKEDLRQLTKHLFRIENKLNQHNIEHARDKSDAPARNRAQAEGIFNRALKTQEESSRLVKLKFVNYRNDRLMQSAWDALDYTSGSSLRIGDRVRINTKYGEKVGVIIQLGGKRDLWQWDGPLTEITDYMRSK